MSPKKSTHQSLYVYLKQQGVVFLVSVLLSSIYNKCLCTIPRINATSIVTITDYEI